MRMSASYDQARASRRFFTNANKSDVWVNTYIGTNLAQRHAAGHTDPSWEPDDPATYPMAFLVEQVANATTPPHFHRADQFQVFVAGRGEFGGEPVGPVTVHFAAAYSPYGPIVAGPEGINYFTLRNSWDSGPRWMPENRGELRQSGRRYRGAVAPSWAAASAADLTWLTETARATLSEPEADGLGAWAFRLPPATKLEGPDPADGAGQYWLALSGSCVAEGTRLAPLSCLFLSKDEPPLSIETESEGVELIAMQYPRRST